MQKSDIQIFNEQEIRNYLSGTPISEGFRAELLVRDDTATVRNWRFVGYNTEDMQELTPHLFFKGIYKSGATDLMVNFENCVFEDVSFRDFNHSKLRFEHCYFNRALFTTKLIPFHMSQQQLDKCLGWDTPSSLVVRECQMFACIFEAGFAVMNFWQSFLKGCTLRKAPEQPVYNWDSCYLKECDMDLSTIDFGNALEAVGAPISFPSSYVTHSWFKINKEDKEEAERMQGQFTAMHNSRFTYTGEPDATLQESFLEPPTVNRVAAEVYAKYGTPEEQEEAKMELSGLRAGRSLSGLFKYLTKAVQSMVNGHMDVDKFTEEFLLEMAVSICRARGWYNNAKAEDRGGGDSHCFNHTDCIFDFRKHDNAKNR